MKIIAKAKKNQKLVNQAVNALLKYNMHNDLRDKADDEGNEKEYNKQNRLCEKYFDKYLEAEYELPKTEIKQIHQVKNNLW